MNKDKLLRLLPTYKRLAIVSFSCVLILFLIILHGTTKHNLPLLPGLLEYKYIIIMHLFNGIFSTYMYYKTGK